MEERNWPARLSLFVSLALLCSCGAGKKSVRLDRVPSPEGMVQESVSAAPCVDSHTPAVTVPPPTLLEERIDVIIVKGTQLVEEGKRLSSEGKIDDARRCFGQALESIKGAGIDFFLNPRLEQAYYQLLKEIQTEELRALMRPPQVIPPELENTSPLDEISDLNLFLIEVDPALRELVSQDLLETRFDIPVVLNEDVLKFLNFYQNRGRRIMEHGLRRSGKYLELFRESFQREGLPLDLVYAAHVESLFNPRARSRAGAVGLWQFVSGTGQLYDLRQNWWIDERRDIVKSTRAAARYLKDLYGAFQDWQLALAAYNVGPARIEKIRKKHGPLDYWTMSQRRLLPKETCNYVPSILASLIIFRHPQRYGFDVVPDPPLQFDQVEVDFQVDTRVVADLVGTNAEALQELNPELKYGVTPGGPGNYLLKVPAGRGELVRTKLAELPTDQRLRLAHHRVRRGETLGLIAKKFRASITSIVQMNRLKSANRLKVGQDLIIPGAGWRETAQRVEAPSQPRRTSIRHVVKRGDSLGKIAKRYGVAVSDLRRWNNLKRGELIYPGQTLRLTHQSAGRSAADLGGAQ